MSERLNRQERKAQTRDRLIDAAAEVFARRGFETASIDEVAAAAGYTKGAVYSNFASKTDLLIAVLERRIASQSAQYSGQFEGQDLETMARGLFGTPDRLSDSNREWLVLAMEFWLHAMRDALAGRLVAEQYEHARTIVTDFLVASGYRTRPDLRLEPREMAIVIEAVGTGLALQAALDPDHIRLSLIADVVAALMGMPGRPVPGTVASATG